MFDYLQKLEYQQLCGLEPDSASKSVLYKQYLQLQAEVELDQQNELKKHELSLSQDDKFSSVWK